MKRSNLYLACSLVFFLAAAILFQTSRPNLNPVGKSHSIDPRCQEEDESPSVSSRQPRNEVVRDGLDYDAHVLKLKETIGREFTVVVEKPFVVIGDQSPNDVKQWAHETIRWAVSQNQGFLLRKGSGSHYQHLAL